MHYKKASLSQCNQLKSADNTIKATHPTAYGFLVFSKQNNT